MDVADTAIMEIIDVTKIYPGVKALKNVSFAIQKGEIHAVVGENGAGKSTLMKILSGIETQTSGKIRMNGELRVFHDVKQGIELGINLISQELNIVPELSVYENIFIGSELNTKGFLKRKEMIESSKILLKRLGAPIDVHTQANRLSVAEQQQVEIARALRYEGKVLIMDEPTASLSETETENLFDVIRKLKDQGMTTIFISHRLPEVMQIADAVTVLRDGAYIGTMYGDQIDEQKIVKWMVGRELSDYYHHKVVTDLSNEEYFKVVNVGDGKKVRDVSFFAKKGELLCLAGLVGSGRTEFCNLVFGVAPRISGNVFLNGSEIVPDPSLAIKSGVGYVPEDRKSQGLFLELSCSMNITTNIIDSDRISRHGIVNLGKIKEISEQSVKEHKIHTPNIQRQVIFLSGGNQQKVLLARWLETKPSLLILDEPTRGIDVGAKSEIYELMGELVSNGVTVLMISSDLPEIIGMAQRILVMREGQIVTELVDKKDFSQEKIMAYASGIIPPDYMYKG
ncbi:MAG: sugar ABC transporter ATP-binding protein [Sphaerochaetaceae bacterium]|nr:sugar ABC transporter ATP-binding protein [Sphaerochaetaceae bacterium]